MLPVKDLLAGTLLIPGARKAPQSRLPAALAHSGSNSVRPGVGAACVAAAWIAGRGRLEGSGLRSHRNRVERDGIARAIPPLMVQQSESRVSGMERNPASSMRFLRFPRGAWQRV
jgi:hypothetical protein